jgi:hypothetical protein
VFPQPRAVCAHLATQQLPAQQEAAEDKEPIHRQEGVIGEPVLSLDARHLSVARERNVHRHRVQVHHREAQHQAKTVESGNATARGNMVTLCIRCRARGA